MSRFPTRWIPLLLLALAALPARAADVCACGAGDRFDWGPVGATRGGGWTCGGGNGLPGGDDHFRVGAGCVVRVVDDVLQDATADAAGLEVEAGGTLRAAVRRERRLRLSLGGLGLECRGTCRLVGAFRRHAAPPPAPGAPAAFAIDAVVPCGGDCTATPELGCIEVAPGVLPRAEHERALARIEVARDLHRRTRDWVCLWDFDKSDHVLSHDDNACYPVVSVDPRRSRICVDVRQGMDNDYPHRLRVLHEGTLAAPLTAGDGCGWVIDAASDLRVPQCGGSVVRVEGLPGAPDPVADDGELIGRFLRFADAAGAPRDASHKILQTLDCSAAPSAPHVCGGETADVVVVGDLRGVAAPQASGDRLWIDYGWRGGDAFFVMVPVQVDSATPGNDDTGIHFDGGVADVHAVHFTDLGGGSVGARANGTPGNNRVVRLTGATVARWKHVVLRNDTGNFRTNSGVDFMPDGVRDAVFGHTNIVSNTGHAVLVSAAHGEAEAVFEDFSIRHAGDGCFNHAGHRVTPEITVRRSWCAFIERDANSAQWFAWQDALPQKTVVEDSGCDACDADNFGGNLRSNNPAARGWTARRLLFWATMGGTTRAPESRLENSLFLGFRGQDTISTAIFPRHVERLVARNVRLRETRPVLVGTLDLRDSMLRDLTVGRHRGAIRVHDGSRIENTAFLGFDTIEPACEEGSDICRLVISDGADVQWLRVLFAWPPGRPTGFTEVLKLASGSVAAPPLARGLAIANHDFVGGDGTAVVGLQAHTLASWDWSDGPCFAGNDRDVVARVEPGLPATTVRAPALGLVDPSSGRFDPAPGSPAGLARCATDPDVPAGNLGLHYVHLRAGLAPEMLARDDDHDGWPDDVGGAPCTGTDGGLCRDNCPDLFNPGQEDPDGDGLGTPCDGPAAEGGACGLGHEIVLGLAVSRRLRRRRA